jgi:drug/metabolite transporter (DMT)-like permease
MASRDVGWLLVLGALWGASFLFTRVASPALGPLPLAAVRTGLAAAVLLPLLRATGWGAIRQRPRQFLVLGLLNAALPFALIAFATLTLTASLAAVINATTPAFTAVAAWTLLGDRVTPR